MIDEFEERARAVIQGVEGDLTGLEGSILEDAITAALRAAYEAGCEKERAACARIAKEVAEERQRFFKKGRSTASQVLGMEQGYLAREVRRRILARRAPKETP